MEYMMLLWSYKRAPMGGAPYKFAEKGREGWGEVNSIDPLIHINSHLGCTLDFVCTYIMLILTYYYLFSQY